MIHNCVSRVLPNEKKNTGESLLCQQLQLLKLEIYFAYQIQGRLRLQTVFTSLPRLLRPSSFAFLLLLPPPPLTPPYHGSIWRELPGKFQQDLAFNEPVCEMAIFQRV